MWGWFSLPCADLESSPLQKILETFSSLAFKETMSRQWNLILFPGSPSDTSERPTQPSAAGDASADTGRPDWLKVSARQNSFGNATKVTHFKEGAEERLAEGLSQTAILGRNRKVVSAERQKTGLGRIRVGGNKEGCASKDVRFPCSLGVKGTSVCWQGGYDWERKGLADFTCNIFRETWRNQAKACSQWSRRWLWHRTGSMTNARWGNGISTCWKESNKFGNQPTEYAERSWEQ